MLKVLCVLILSIITLVPAIFAYKRSDDAFSPISFYNFFMFISIVPRLALMEENVYTKTLSDETLSRYVIITVFGITMVNIFFLIFVKKLRLLYPINNSNMHLDLIDRYENNRSIIGIYLIFCVGALSKIYLLIRSGGIRYIWANINQRTVMLSGNNYINSLEVLMIIACALILEKYLSEDKKKYGVTLIFFCVTTSLLLLSFGGRSSFVKLAVLLFIVINYRYKHFDIRTVFKPKYVVLLIILSLVIVMIPMVRNKDFSNIYQSPGLWIKEALKNLSNVFESISAVDRDMMTYDIFAERDFWYGKTYLGLLYAWIPRSLFADKPPVDDGVYLANLIRGYYVEPVMPYSQITLHSSSPFSSFGIMYANFGIIGIVLGALILSSIYFYLYKKMTLKGNDIGSVLIYGYLMLAFGLSIHSILSLLIPSIIIWIVIGKKPFRFVLGKHK